MASVTLKGREIPLLYTVYEMKLIQEEICPIDDFSYRVLGKNKDDEKDNSLFGKPEHLETVAKLVKILGNAGLEEAGETPNLTAKGVLRSIKPGQFSTLVGACIAAMSEGMASEYKSEKSEEAQDVVLAEINKKKEQDS